MLENRLIWKSRLVSDIDLKRLATSSAEVFSFCHVVSVDEYSQEREPEIRLDMKTLTKVVLKFLENREHKKDQSRARPPV